MDYEIRFPGGDRVDAVGEAGVIRTDQGDSAPAPFDLFLASIGTCVGAYVLRFCRQRGLDTKDIRIIQRVHEDPSSGLIDKIELRIDLPEDFPEAYREPVARAARLCRVKKHLQRPPAIEVITSDKRSAVA
ncbi:MAG: OsmC family protein [Acidobacteriota bacterium]|nr:OsmC family protein [Acidobacteriota bacterium]